VKPSQISDARNDTKFRPPEAAPYIGTTPGTLAQWRYLGKGPKYLRLPGSRTILYRKTDLDAWLDSGEVAPSN
jgi:hypothetical protein